MNEYGLARWEWEDKKRAQERLGRMVFDCENWFCSDCGFHVTGRYGTEKFRYCPGCGAKMEDR